MCPVIKEFIESVNYDVHVCVTAQHREMLDQVLALFEITPDHDLNIMKLDQSLEEITSSVLTRLGAIFEQFHYDLVFVHGDTTTTMAAALAAFYHKMPVAHVEAGLRTRDMYSPWPEEMNRKIAGVVATYHLAPTAIALDNLLEEGVDKDNIVVTGNTVIDALIQAVNLIESDGNISNTLNQRFSFIDQAKRLILVTGHRRENFGQGFENIFSAIRQIATSRSDVQVIYPTHLNPNVKGPATAMLSGLDNVYLLDPQEYLAFVYLIQNCYLILTDSGGVQEEAPSLGKPVLVMRNTSERPEAISAGTAILVGTDENAICQEVFKLLDDSEYYSGISKLHNPYGDGKASQRILEAVDIWL